MKATRVFSLVLATAALNACTFSPLIVGPTQTGPRGGGGLISNANGLTNVSGAVKAPRSYAAVGGDPFTKSAGLIAAGGMNYRLQQDAPLGDEDYVPLGGTEVYLADGEGTPLPGSQPAITNERGEFRFPGVPEGLTYVVVARAKTRAGKPVALKTLVRGKDGRGDIDPASTLATEAITEGAGKDIGQLDPERFKRVRETIAQDLAKGGTPDLSNREAVKARIEKLKAQYAEVREAVDDLRSDLKKTQAELEKLRAELAAQKQAQQPPVGEPRPLTCVEGFKQRDKNGDGVVEAAEVGESERFKELDRDGDGKLRLEDLCDQPVAPLPDADCDGAFRRLDADGDGMLDYEQVLRILPTVNKVEGGATRPAIAIDEPGVQRMAIKQMDRDGDGRISRDEFCGKPPVGIEPVPCEALFKRADLDRDGIVTYEESAKLDQNETGDPNVRFLKERDRDGDGKLTLAEACGGAELPPADPCEMRFQRWGGGDGRISWEEAVGAGLPKERFVVADRNRDGWLDREEFSAVFCGGAEPLPVDPCGEKFQGLAGGDGQLSYEEATALGWSKERFVAMDRNGSGTIDRQEFCETVTTQPVEPPCMDKFFQLAGRAGVVSYEAALAAGWGDSFKKIDLNQDGVVGPREYGWAFCGEPMPQPQPLPPAPSPCEERFMRAAGSDGAINPEDLGNAGWSKEMFLKYDANQDGKVDRREFGAVFCGEPQPEPVTTMPIATNPCDERFKRAAGPDGAITLDEIGALGWSKDQFYKYDRNQDQKLDRREFGWGTCNEPMPTDGLLTTR